MITRYRFNNNSVHQDAAMSWLLCGQNMGWLLPDPAPNPNEERCLMDDGRRMMSDVRCQSDDVVDNREELFHFIHPEIEEEEELKIHNEVKRLVKHHGLQDICKYLVCLKDNNKVLLPQNAERAYEELVRMGMPDGEGYTLKTFMKHYKR